MTDAPSGHPVHDRLSSAAGRVRAIGPSNAETKAAIRAATRPATARAARRWPVHIGVAATVAAAAITLAFVSIDRDGKVAVSNDSSASTLTLETPCLRGPSAEVLVCDGESLIYHATGAAPGDTGWFVDTPNDDDAPMPLRSVEGDLDGVWVFSAETPNGLCALAYVDGQLTWREACVENAGAWFLAGTSARPIQFVLSPNRIAESVTELDPDASFLTNGCITSVGELLAEIAPEQMIDALRCADDGSIGVVRLTSTTAGEGDFDHLQLLSRSEDGSWSMSSSAQETAGGCESHDLCETFGVARDLSEVPLPLPSPRVAAQVVPSAVDGGTPLPPSDITNQYADWTPVASADELRQLVLADLPSEDETVQTSMLPEGAGPIIVTTTHHDDAAGGTTLVIWAKLVEGGLGVDLAYRIVWCTRGTTEQDGATLCL